MTDFEKRNLDKAGQRRYVLDECPTFGRVIFADSERWTYTAPEKYLQMMGGMS